MRHHGLSDDLRSQNKSISDQTASFAQNVLIGREPEALEHISSPGVAAAIWHRTPSEDFQRWINNVPFEQLPELDAVINVELCEKAVHAACDAKNLAPGPERDMLASDTAALAFIYGQIMKTRFIKIRLDVTDEVMCPRFHLDNVTARMLCTYRGPGTEYVTKADLEKTDRVSQMASAAVGLFRGKKWSPNEGCGLLHRSPEIDPRTGARLLLVIDPADQPE